VNRETTRTLAGVLTLLVIGVGAAVVEWVAVAALLAVSVGGAAVLLLDRHIVEQPLPRQAELGALTVVAGCGLSAVVAATIDPVIAQLAVVVVAAAGLVQAVRGSRPPKSRAES